jgi:hypothetical protein
MHDFGLFQLAQKLKLKYILVSVGTVWETGSLFSLTFAVMHFVGIMCTSFAVVLVQIVTVRPRFIVLGCIALAEKLWRL